MSHRFIVNQKYSSFNDKLIYQNTQNNYNTFRYYSSLIKNKNKNYKPTINTSSNIYNCPHKTGYIETESNLSNTNACSCINCTNTLNSNLNLNTYYYNLENSKKYHVNYKIFHMDKNSKNRFCSAKIKKKNNYNKDNEIYLNKYINTSSDEKINKRIQSSKGFLRKIDIELNQLLSNKTNKKQFLTIPKNHNNKKYLNLNFHNNNYIYDYISNDVKENNNIKKKLFFNTNHKSIDTNDMPNNDYINSFNNNMNLEQKDNFFKMIINNITRKVLFLNEKNDLLSDENTMNLLNNEEYYLYQKLNNFFKDNYSIKKFSKSILDEKNGNKYLLPLFNTKILSKYNYGKNEELEHKNKIKKNKFNNYNLINELNDLNDMNNKNKFNKKIITVNSKTNLYKENKKLNIVEFPLNLDGLPEKINKKKIINLSNDKNNIKYLLNKRKKEKNLLLNKDILNSDNNNPKDNLTNMNSDRKVTNTLDNFILESTKKIEKCDFTPIKTKITPKKTKDISKNNTIYLNRLKRIKNFINKKYNHDYLDRKKEIVNREIDLDKENDISIISKNKNRNKRRSIGNNLKNKNEKSEEKKIDDDSIDINENDEKIVETNNNEENKENIDDKNKRDKKNSAKRLLNEKKRRETKRLLKINANLNLKNFDLDNNKITKNENEKNNKKLIMKKLILSGYDNLNDTSSSFDIEQEEQKLKELKRITMSNNIILKKNIQIEEKKLIVRIEKKKSKTIKLLYQYIKRNIKETIKKEKIKELLTQQEFRDAIDLLKTQIDKTREFSNDESNKIITPVTDDEIVDMLYTGLMKEEENLNESQKSKNPRKSTYIPSVHLKGKNEEKKENKKEEEKESEEVIKIKREREKEKEKLKIMVNEMTLSNELRFHIQETNNKELRERFQTLLSQIESYQNLNMTEYVEAIKNNYLLLKEEMNKILSDKEMEDRINGFVTNLDIERNVMESKWNYLSNKLTIIDNKFMSVLEKLRNYDVNNEEN